LGILSKTYVVKLSPLDHLGGLGPVGLGLLKVGAFLVLSLGVSSFYPGRKPVPPKPNPIFPVSEMITFI